MEIGMNAATCQEVSNRHFWLICKWDPNILYPLRTEGDAGITDPQKALGKKNIFGNNHIFHLA